MEAKRVPLRPQDSSRVNQNPVTQDNNVMKKPLPVQREAKSSGGKADGQKEQDGSMGNSR